MIKALSNILFNGTTYVAGDVLPEMEEKAEKQLIDAGSAEYVRGPVMSEPKKPSKKANPDAPSVKWNKTKLVGFARNIGLTADSTMTKEELVDMIEKAPEVPEVKEKEIPAVTVNEVNPTPQPDMDKPVVEKTEVKE